VAGDHFARKGQHPFRAGGVDGGEGGRIGLDHALGDAVMVAQVDEDQPAMVAAPVDPARQADGLPDIGLAKLAAGVGAIGVHGGFSKETQGFWRFMGGRSRAGQTFRNARFLRQNRALAAH
jgi:hypothetical protein